MRHDFKCKKWKAKKSHVLLLEREAMPLNCYTCVFWTRFDGSYIYGRCNNRAVKYGRWHDELAYQYRGNKELDWDAVYKKYVF